MVLSPSRNLWFLSFILLTLFSILSEVPRTMATAYTRYFGNSIWCDGSLTVASFLICWVWNKHTPYGLCNHTHHITTLLCLASLIWWNQGKILLLFCELAHGSLEYGWRQCDTRWVSCPLTNFSCQTLNPAGNKWFNLLGF